MLTEHLYAILVAGLLAVCIAGQSPTPTFEKSFSNKHLSRCFVYSSLMKGHSTQPLCMIASLLYQAWIMVQIIRTASWKHSLLQSDGLNPSFQLKLASWICLTCQAFHPYSHQLVSVLLVGHLFVKILHMVYEP